MINFRSDNNAGVDPRIMAALIAEAGRQDDAYGRDAQTAGLDALWSDIFGTSVQVIPLVSGTAANAIGIASLSPSHGAVLCHADAHILWDEVNAPGFFQPGLMLWPVDGPGGKIDPRELERLLSSPSWKSLNRSQPAVLSLTQATEWGTAYTVDELCTLTTLAKSYGLPVHMDGARLANAIVHLGTTPAEVTWKSGVDVLSLGATKNGCLMAEALVIFGDGVTAATRFKAKQTGHVVSKLRFASAQLLAYGREGLWLGLARKANSSAERLARDLSCTPGATLHLKPEANIVFAKLMPSMLDAVACRDIAFYRWDDSGLARFVTSFDTTDRDIQELLDAIRS